MDNRDKEEKLKVYQNMLRYGQIDEATYNNMVSRNIGNIDDLNKHKINIKPLIVVVLLCLFVFLIFKLINVDNVNDNYQREYEYVDSYNSIDAPIQNSYTGSTNMIVRNVNVDVEYVAYYEVSGRVVAKRDYLSTDVKNDTARTDVALVWGKLATEDYLNHIDWTAPGNRFIYWQTNDMNWFKRNTSNAEVISSFSNNHLVTADTNLLKGIRSIKDGDYVRIKGYLVNLYWNEDGENYWKTSTVRTDDGDGACEVIYVTDIKWLKEA